MPASPSPHHTASDENQVITILGLGLITLALLFGGGYWLYQHLQARETQAAQAQLYREYRRNTEVTEAIPASPPPVLAAQQEAQRIREKLLAHPGVTPAPGFMSPGVQTTGLAIVEAIDHAQARDKTAKAPGT